MNHKPKILTRIEIARDMAVAMPRVTVKEAIVMLNAALESILAANAAGRTVELRKFGRFRPARQVSARKRPGPDKAAGFPRVEISYMRFRMSPQLLRRRSV